MVQVMKKTATSDKVAKIEPLSVREKMDIDAEIQAIESQLKEAKETGRINNISEQGVKDMETQKKKLELAIEKNDKSNLDIADKNRILVRVRELEKLIMDGMCTPDEMRGGSAKYPGVLEKHISHQMRTQHLQLEWKRLKRILEPDNPASSNVEILRNKL